MIGDCYYLLHKEEFAGQWYDAARKQWPDFQDIPVKTIMNMANHYFTARQFSSSLQIVSLYYNLYPEDEFGKKALFMMARNAEAMGQTAMALQFYRLYIEKYPTDAEAETCLIAMAALGVAKPGIKFPFQVLPMDAYESPLRVLESLLAKKPGGEKEAALLLSQGDALVKQNRLPEGLASYQTLVSRFPRAKGSDEARKKLTLQARSLVNESYEKGDYLAVADIYFRGYGQDVAPRDDFNTAVRMGDSLLMTGLYYEAAAMYGALKKIYPDRARESIITLALAKIDVAKNMDSAAEEKLLALLSAGGAKNPALRNDIKATLANLYYKKGLSAKANPLYAEVLQAGGEDRARLYRNYGRSLQAAKLSDQAILNYLKALKDFQQRPKSYPADVLTDIYGGLGDAYFDVKRYPEGIEAYRQALARAGEEDGEVRKWLTYMIGKGATEVRDFVGAQKSFASVKANAAGDFWPKVADYSLERSRARENAGNQNE
jgi:tetratricopeptide (TPR) repeat protein